MLKFSYNYNKYNKLYFHFSGTIFFYTFFLITALKTNKVLLYVILLSLVSLTQHKKSNVVG